jgi:hypothetical protein
VRFTRSAGCAFKPRKKLAVLSDFYRESWQAFYDTKAYLEINAPGADLFSNSIIQL